MIILKIQIYTWWQFIRNAPKLWEIDIVLVQVSRQEGWQVRLLWVRRSLLLLSLSRMLNRSTLSIDGLNVLQDLFERQLLLSISIDWHSLSRQDLIQFIWRNILVDHLRIIIIVVVVMSIKSSSWPLWLLWILLSWVLLIVQVLELVLARRRVEESWSWVIRWWSSDGIICIIRIVVIIILLLLPLSKVMSNLMLIVPVLLFAHIPGMPDSMRQVSVDNVFVIIRRGVIVNVHQGWPLTRLLIHRVLHVIPVLILIVLGLVGLHLRHLRRQLSVHSWEEGATFDR